MNTLLCTTETTKGKAMRYKIFKGSMSMHCCCFEATVMDTTKPVIVGGEHYAGYDGQLHYAAVCECFNLEDAQLICDALNAKQHLAEVERLNAIISRLSVEGQDAVEM